MNILLTIAALLSAVAALLHLCIILAGPSWYRFFGAGEKFATMVEQGSLVPHAVTFAIAVVLSIWSAYAFSAAGLLPALPLLKLALIVITSIYLLRGVGGFWIVFKPTPEHSASFAFWSSSICLGIGLVHLVGLMQIWGTL